MTTPARIPNDEADRLAALRRYAILDTPPDEALDKIVKLAARQFDTPIALVSLVDENRQWFKAACGLDAKETDRDVAFCAHAILGEEVFVVLDATEDPRFSKNPLVVGGPKIRYYAGAPLINPDGYKLGALCIIDQRPRPDFSREDRDLLADLAAIVVDQIDLAVVEHQLGLFYEYAPVAVAMFDREMRYLGASRRWREIFAIQRTDYLGRTYDETCAATPPEWKAHHQRCLNGETIELEEEKLPRSDGGFHWVRRRLRPWRDARGDIGGLIEFVEIIDKRKSAESALEQSTRFTAAVLDHIHDGIVACDAKGHLSIFNKSTRRFHGVDSEPLPPEKWAERYDLYEPDGVTPLAVDRIPLYRAYSGEVVDGQEMVIAPAGQERRIIVASGSAMYGEDGEKLGAVVSMHDVTSERAAQERWREANARYRAIFDGTFQFCGFLDVDGTLLEANETALKFGGFTREDVVGKKFWEAPWWRISAPTQAQLRDAIDRAGNGEFIRYEVDMWGEGRKATPIDFSLKPVCDAEGKVVNLIAEGRDISETRQNEEALRRNKAELELILNNVPIRIFYKDDKNRIVRLNQPAAESMGMTVEAAEGRNTYDLFPALAKKYHDDDLEVIESGQPKIGIIERCTPLHQEQGWVRTDKIPYTDPKTGERFVFVAAMDITTEKQAEIDLRASEQRYRNLYNKAPVMLASIDSQGRHSHVSDHWLERLGYDREEVVDRPGTDILTTDSARRFVEKDYPELLRTGECKDLEYQVVTKSGEVLDVLMSGIAEYDEDGDPVGAMAVISDITDRKNVERKLIQAQKMESVGQLTGGLAHDFNNLLAVIAGNLQLVARSLPDDEKTGRRIGAAIKAAERGAELTKRLLAFSRRQKLETQIIDANPLIEGISDMLKRTLGEDIDLECRLAEGLPAVRTDVAQLESAVLNLAVNARDAMPDGGTLTIETTTARIEASPTEREPDLAPGLYVVLAVTDTGCGIPAEDNQKVFDPFYTTKEVGKGSGLGLSMVYGFMKQTGGHVRICSEVGHGTTVRLYLPVKADADASSEADRTPYAGDLGGREKILVVEDQREVREMAVALLEDLGYEVVEAKDAREGLGVISSDNDIDLLFTDIVMPGGMDGAQFAKAAWAIREGLPVIFTTGYAEAAVLRKGGIKVAQNLVTKPYRQSELASKIRLALDSRKAPEKSAAGAA